MNIILGAQKLKTFTNVCNNSLLTNDIEIPKSYYIHNSTKRSLSTRCMVSFIPFLFFLIFLRECIDAIKELD